MRTFSDNSGRTWTVTINVAALKRVRGLLGVDLLTIFEGDLLQRLIADPVLLCDVVFAVCKPEADAHGVTDEDFGRAMAGDPIEAATGALLDEVVGFSPSPKDRHNLTLALRALRTHLDQARDRVTAQLSHGLPATSAPDASGTSSGSAPGSSASTPTP